VTSLKQNALLLAGLIVALVPRELWHLPGIVGMHFLHSGFGHLAANTLPLAAFGALLLTRGAGYFVRALLLVGLGGGVLLWLFGRTAAHIGASGLVFGLFGLLVARAVFAKSVESMLIAALVMLGYGGLIWGVLPTDNAISWDGHLAGLLAGVAAARLLHSPASA